MDRFHGHGLARQCWLLLGLLVFVAGCSEKHSGSQDARLSARVREFHQPIVPVRIMEPPEPKRAGAAYKHPYVFSHDWFTGNIPSWQKLLAPLAGRKNLRYLEVGVYEGRSLLWFFDRIATDETTQGTAIDVKVLQRLRDNLALSGAAARVKLIEGDSKEVLGTLAQRSFDVIYIDGSHRAADVLADAVLCWRLLKVGGILIFDDYRWAGLWRQKERRVLPPEFRPKLAIEAFVSTHLPELEIAFRGYQLAVRRRSPRCATGEQPQSSLGPYCYHWKAKRLVDSRTNQSVKLNRGERRLIETLLRSRPLGRLDIVPSPTLRASYGFKPLLQRLGLTFPRL